MSMAKAVSEQATERPDSHQIAAERSTVRVYRWLLLSPLLTVPASALLLFVLEMGTSYRGPSGSDYLLLLLPAVVHAVLLPGLRSPYLFVRRHYQQGVILAGLRTLCAAFLVLEVATCNAAIVQAVLWLGGSLLGRRQVRRGQCWLMHRRGETRHLPRPWAPQASHRPVATATDSRDVDRRERAAVKPGAEAIADHLEAFRNGPPAARRAAIADLQAMGEVEQF